MNNIPQALVIGLYMVIAVQFFISFTAEKRSKRAKYSLLFLCGIFFLCGTTRLTMYLGVVNTFTLTNEWMLPIVAFGFIVVNQPSILVRSLRDD